MNFLVIQFSILSVWKKLRNVSFIQPGGLLIIVPLLFFKRHKLLYDYQLIWKDGRITEKRILLEENGREKNIPNAPLKTKRFKHKKIIFGPIGLLSPYWQKRHTYRIIREERLKGQETLVLEALTSPSAQTKHLYGKIWVNLSDGSILKLEWKQESLENYDLIQNLARQFRAKPRITLIAEYFQEKKGLRFPSRVIIKEDYLQARNRVLRVSELIIKYKNYKFFTVETKVQYR
ncbi:MAG: hypothetical protein J7L26_01670 [Candidatus Aminicenantes bacterium]|nr:hypothetical protein [Candidatus Aminicenantes bacterium]